jgi:uncharacterized repeat protein (TIGR01451 family)
MKLGVYFYLQVLILVLCSNQAFGGTPAGTTIRNQALLKFTVQNAPGEVQSNATSFTVVQLLGVALTSQDATAVGVNSPDINRVLTFRVTNIGNGTESYRLSRDDAVPGDNFDPIAPATPGAGLYLENGLQPGFQATGLNADTLYTAGSNDPQLSAGDSRLVYLISAIPAGQAYQDSARSRLIATSAQSDVLGKAPGAALPPLGSGALERVVGLSRGQADATGGYRVTGVQTSLVKTVVKVLDPQGGSTVMPGAVLTYRLVSEMRGAGTASNFNITDTLPAQVRYKSGTLLVNGAAQTDAADADFSEVDVAAVPHTLRVRLGSRSAPFLAIVEFDVIVE